MAVGSAGRWPANAIAVALALGFLVPGVGAHLPTAAPGLASVPAGDAAVDGARSIAPLTTVVPGTAAGAPSATPQTVTEYWTDISAHVGDAPSPRTGAALEFDAADNLSVLFGGWGDGASRWLNDTWEFANGTWRNVTTAFGPPAVVGPAMAYDPDLGGIVLAVGLVASPTGPVEATATWLFSDGSWEDLSASLAGSPPAVASAAVAYDPAASALVLVGGLAANGTSARGTYLLANATWTDLGVNVGLASGLCCAGLAFDAPDATVVLAAWVGGSLDTYEFASGAWTLLHPAESPPARYYPASGFDPLSGAVTLFGGRSTWSGATFYNDTWRFANDTWSNLSLSSAPTPRAGAASTFDPDEHGLVVFGGNSSATGGATADTWVLGERVTPSVIGLANRTQVALLAPVQFTATVSGNGTPPYSYSWAFGDNTSGSGAVANHRYGLVGNYSAQVTVTDAAGLSAMSPLVYIRVYPRPSGISPSSSLEASEVSVPIAFTATAQGGTPPYAYVWAFDDGTTTPGRSVNHTYAAPGEYTVSVSATDSLGGQIIGYLGQDVAPHLALAIRLGTASTEVGLTESFDPGVSGGVAPYTFAWSLGDGTMAGSSSFEHAYAAAGTYPVTLSVVDALGISANGTTSVTVAAPVGVTGAANVTSTDVGLPIGFTSVATNGSGTIDYVWTFGDGSSSSAAAPSHTYALAGAYPVSVTALDQLGVSATAWVNVTVNVLPSVQVNVSKLEVPFGGTVAITATVHGGTGPYAVAWSFGDGRTATGLTVSHVYDVAGSYEARVNATDAAGLTVTAWTAVTVLPAGTGGLPTPPPPSLVSGSTLPWIGAFVVIAAGIAIGLAVYARRRAARSATAASETDSETPDDDADAGPMRPH